MNRVKLFCLPYAGGSSYLYLPWKSYLSDAIELHPIQLAGRGERILDPEYGSMEEAAEDVFREIKEEILQEADDYILFGHSMGSWIIYEVAKKIVNANFKVPNNIIFSGNCAPYYPFNRQKIAGLSKGKFINKILCLGGARKEVLENKEFGDFFLEVLRRDFRMIENYICKNNTLKIDCNITVFNGTDDCFSKSSIFSWQECGTKKIDIFNFKGNHFFIDSCREEVVSSINKIVNDI